MKITKVIFALVTVLLLCGLFSFQSKTQLFPTKLRVTVLDGLGNFTPDVQVTLYQSETDYQNSKNPVQSGTTDKKGRITFEDLQPKVYFVDARKDDMNNNGEGVVTAPLVEGKVNKINTVIE